MFPSPASKSFTVRFGQAVGNTTLLVQDLMGRTVHSLAIGAPVRQVAVNAPGLSNGLYLVKVRVQGKNLVKRVVIQK